MELIPEDNYYIIVDSIGVSNFMLLVFGKPTLFNTRLELLQKQLEMAKSSVSQYVRNVSSKKFAQHLVTRLEQKMEDEKVSMAYLTNSDWKTHS